MRSGRGVVARVAVSAFLVLFGASALTGCTPETPKPTRAPSPKPTPLFASDEEALAAATEAYQRYLDVSNAVGQGGWKDTAPLREVETGEALRDEIANAEQYRGEGLTQRGEITFTQTRVQSFDSEALAAYICVDVSNVFLVDRSGNTESTDGRADDSTLEVRFEPRKGNLLINRSEVWSGSSIC